MSEDENPAVKAARFFHTRHYGKAKETLNQLKSKNANDFKVQHNFAICDLYVKGKTKQSGEALLGELLKIKKQMQGDNEDGGRSISKSFDSSFLSYNIAVVFTHLKHYSQAIEELKPLFKDIEPLDDFLAICVCLLLTDLYLLQGDVTLVSQTLGYVEKLYKEIQSKMDTSDDLNSSQEWSENSDNENTKPEKSVSTSNTKESEKETDATSKPLSHYLTSHLLQRAEQFYGLDGVSVRDLELSIALRRARLHLIQRQFKNIKKDIKLATSKAVSSGDEYKYSQFTTLMFKSHLEYLRNNNKKAVQILTSQDPTCGQVVEKNELNHSSKSKQTSPYSVLLVGGYPQDVKKIYSFIYYNNLGTTLLRMKKYHTALQTYMLALEECAKASEHPNGKGNISNISLRHFALDARYEILYNTGVCLLMIGDYVQAGKCFGDSSQLLSNSPYLWLRIAECCVANHRTYLKTLQQQQPLPNISYKQIRNSNYVFLPWLNNISSKTLEENDANGLSIAYGIRCCKNALTLLNLASMSQNQTNHHNHQNNHSNNSDNSESNSNNINNTTNHLNNLHIDPQNEEDEYLNESHLADKKVSHLDLFHPHSSTHIFDMFSVKMMVHLNLCYLSLSVGDHQTCLKSAMSVLTEPVPEVENSEGIPENTIKLWKFYAHIYTSEAFLMMNNVGQSVGHLQYVITQNLIPTQIQIQTQDADKMDGQGQQKTDQSANDNLLNEDFCWSGNEIYTTSQVKATVFSNLSLSYILNGDLEKAVFYAKKAILFDPNLIQAQLILTYSLRKKGDPEQALHCIRWKEHIIPPIFSFSDNTN